MLGSETQKTLDQWFSTCASWPLKDHWETQLLTLQFLTVATHNHYEAAMIVLWLGRSALPEGFAALGRLRTIALDGFLKHNSSKP